MIGDNLDNLFIISGGSNWRVGDTKDLFKDLKISTDIKISVDNQNVT